MRFGILNPEIRYKTPFKSHKAFQICSLDLAVAENSDQLPTILRALQQLYVLQEQERQERW